ncbi:hypothetical protein THAOC_03557 [Thalassiosira oceanica]|uniref:Uncharacterized protein n=1 Tax=Thalassiosira oceanica TaxID=159749 RepID=K0T7M0_THAOC|nr:hypothetical protein THAOC_03557 [Thalassiosira oceanica]|eukprot:EJK74748.1 hypothetical protein THAOC_03557 [Thalassiosira oceanica]
MKLSKFLMKDTSSPNYEQHARWVKQFEEQYGEDWDSTTIEYDNDYLNLPWVNAKWEEGGNTGLLVFAARMKQHELMSYLLLNGADVNILNYEGVSVLTSSCLDEDIPSKGVRLLLSWGAEHIESGKQMTKERKLAFRREIAAKGNAEIANLISTELGGRRCDIVSAHVEIANLISSELGGRRCEIVSAPNTRDDLVGKTCVAGEYVEESDQYRVMMEFTNEVLLLDVVNLKRRDRTPQDPGYYVECKNNRLVRRDFKSNEECRAFIASLRADDDELIEIDPEAEAKAEHAAADLLAELGLEDLEGPSSKANVEEGGEAQGEATQE